MDIRIEIKALAHPYILKDQSKLCSPGLYKVLPVYQYLKPLNAYTVIIAKCPKDKHWVTGIRVGLLYVTLNLKLISFLEVTY